MIIFMVIAAVVCCLKMQPTEKTIHEDYLMPVQTTALRGTMIVLVFLSHVRDYVVLNGLGDPLFNAILRIIGQSMVAPFFFYSGYGIMVSYGNKKDYKQGFLRKRVGLTWIHFAVAVCFYYAVDLLLGIHYPFRVFLQSLSGWSDVGNSNWFMFVTFGLYFIAYLGIIICERMEKQQQERKKILAVLILLFSGVFLAGMTLVKEPWWYDTLLCFAFGSFYAILKEKIDSFCKKRKNYGIYIALILTFYILAFHSGGYLSANLQACMFTLLITAVTMHLKIQNPILMWLGKHSFYIYIYMRIPMIVMKHFEILITHPVVFTLVSFTVTCLTAWGMYQFHKKTDTFIF